MWLSIPGFGSVVHIDGSLLSLAIKMGRVYLRYEIEIFFYQSFWHVSADTFDQFDISGKDFFSNLSIGLDAWRQCMAYNFQLSY